MSTGSFSQNITSCIEVTSTIKNKRKRRHNGILKSKENVISSKCNKSLKNKLKKYKLRKDGLEDPDVLDVSYNLLKSLKIKSPTNKVTGSSPSKYDCLEYNNDRKTNFLFKMVKKLKVRESAKCVTDCNSNENDIDSNDIVSDNTGQSSQNEKNTNAFSVMMNSRNKSIGTNSPRKNKNVEDSESEEMLLIRETKIKRTLALKKMVEMKGGGDYNTEMEEYKDQCIKKKMDKRAERLKNMLTKSDNLFQKHESNNVHIEKICTKDNKELKRDFLKTKYKDNSEVMNSIFNDNVISEKILDPEDKEFLNKLSPSLKKKNMLSYFKKVEKESLPNKELHEFDMFKGESDDDTIIKVKLTPKRIKKIKRKKLSLKNTDKDMEKTDSTNDLNLNYVESQDKIIIETPSVKDIKENKEKNEFDRKRKRKSKNDTTIAQNDTNIAQNDIIILSTQFQDERPKRNVKKPVKYVDDVIELTCSDDELHIFTPKKKKTKDINKDKVSHSQEINIPQENNYDSKNKNKTSNNSQIKINATKLAPIFVSKNQKDPILKSNNKILTNDVSNKSRKIISKNSSKTVYCNNFSLTTHVQQNVPLKKCSVDYYALQYEDKCIPTQDNKQFCFLKYENKIDNNIIPEFENNVPAILKNIKKSYPEFPVYRTYRYLKNKLNMKIKDDKDTHTSFNNSSEVLEYMESENKEDAIHLTWTERYRPHSSKDIIGNFESIKELKKWLITWQENKITPKSTSGKTESDSSDFYYNTSDSDSKEDMRRINNVLIISGPVGSGKTSSVYAVAAELSMKVIEVNASSKRTGKIIFQDLQEATQSHKVNRSKVTSSENSQNAQDTAVTNKSSKKNKTKKASINTKNSKNKKLSQISEIGIQDLTQTRMSLILIDDADIVFDQDDGFIPALTQIIQCSKRPVIVVTSSLTCQHLQRFIKYGNVVRMNSLTPKMLGTWLDIMCLADTDTCWPGLGSKYLSFYNGDIRKTINHMQFLVFSQANMAIEMNPSFNTLVTNCFNVEDENSSLSWVDNEIKEDHINTTNSTTLPMKNVWRFISNDNINFLNKMKPITLWWNIPKLLKISDCIDSPETDEVNSNTLAVLANVIDSMSFSDICFKNRFERDLTSDPWFVAESDSVCENETSECYNNYTEIGEDICYTLTKQSIIDAQSVFGQQDVDLSTPGVEIKR